jgi:hypothetical protein
MGERMRVRKWMGLVEVPPPVLSDGKDRFIVLGSKHSEVGGPIIYEQSGGVFMRVGDGYDSDTIVNLPKDSKIKAGSPTPHTYIEIEVVDDQSSN